MRARMQDVFEEARTVDVTIAVVAISTALTFLDNM